MIIDKIPTIMIYSLIPSSKQNADLITVLESRWKIKTKSQQSGLKRVTPGSVPSAADQPGPHASGDPEGTGETQHGGRRPSRLQPLPDAAQRERYVSRPWLWSNARASHEENAIFISNEFPYHSFTCKLTLCTSKSCNYWFFSFKIFRFYCIDIIT